VRFITKLSFTLMNDDGAICSRDLLNRIGHNFCSTHAAVRRRDGRAAGFVSARLEMSWTALTDASSGMNC
jgi:hypothetical protein